MAKAVSMVVSGVIIKTTALAIALFVSIVIVLVVAIHMATTMINVKSLGRLFLCL